jgi:8-oxo-dGTP pyrophosphatase MutT (NUDIX family)
MTSFYDILKSELQKPLPGTGVQLQMGVLHPLLKDLPSAPGSDTRIAAVLILLYPKDGSVFTVFMQRPEYDGIHSGQISFPGGREEPADKNIIETALREAREEVGADPLEISVIGTLTPLFIPVSNILVTPVVGWAERKPEFKCQEEEVVFLIEGDLKKLLEPSIVKSKILKVRDEELLAKYFDYDGYVIWGATAMMLNELLTIILKADGKWSGGF